MTEPFPSATRRLAAFAVATDAADLPASARTFARLSLLDWSAVALAGIDEPVSGIVRELVARDGGAADATVLGLDARLPARAAALANGATSHALDYDDTHFGHIGHPSVAVLPAALAVAEREGASGTELVAAFLVGVETACRVGALLGPGHYRHGFHQTATSGSFGAAAACARLLGLDVDATRHALGLVTTRASGLKSQFGTMGKPFHAGMAAANGVEATDLAALGFVSRPDGLECAQGFAATHAGDPDAAYDALAGLGEAFLFEAVQYKLHACCHGTHAALEALAAIRREHAVAPDAVAAVTLTVNPTWLRVCDLPTPVTGLEAKFSYRLTAAMALAGVDTAALASFSDAACRDPGLVRLRDRVTVVADLALADTAARVVVALDDGRRLEAAHDLLAPRPPAELEAKLQAKAAGLVGDGTAEALHETVTALDRAPAAVLAEALVAAARPAA
jgi:2-methylcitrate dehydratase PrpD